MLINEKIQDMKPKVCSIHVKGYPALDLDTFLATHNLQSEQKVPADMTTDDLLQCIIRLFSKHGMDRYIAWDIEDDAKHPTSRFIRLGFKTDDLCDDIISEMASGD